VSSLGYDAGVDAVTRRTQDLATDSGKPMMTGPRIVPQGAFDAKGSTGFSVYLAIYERGADISTVGARRQAVRGWIGADFIGADFLIGTAGERSDQIALVIRDGAERTVSSLVGSTVRRTPTEGLRAHRVVQALGRTWQIETVALPSFVPAETSAAPWLALAAGLITTLLLTLLVRMLARDRSRAERVATASSAELEHTTQRIDDEVEQRTERLTALVDATADLVAVYDVDGMLIDANPAAQEFYGWDPAAHRLPQHMSDALGAAGPVHWRTELLPVLAFTGVWRGESVALRSDGTEVPLSHLVVEHHDREGQAYYSVVSRDLSERAHYELQLTHQATHDRLTSLPNRPMMLDGLQRLLDEGLDDSPVSLAVLVIDLDRFKLINDSLGHQAGDEVLIEIAHRLASAYGHHAARLGADEFLLVCPGIDDAAAAALVAHDVAALVSQPCNAGGSETHITTSIGIALARSGDGASAHNLLRDADAAVSRAKDRGRACFDIFDDALRRRAVRRLELTDDLHRALDHGDLRVHFQPEVSLADGSIVGVEALVRWTREDGTSESAAEFVAVAEDTGLIAQLGAFVLTEACWQAARWRRVVSANGEPVVVWVNLSARQLARPDLAEFIAALLVDAGCEPRQLGLEITESALLEDADAAIAMLQRLKALGVRLGIDDFGTGYSSLSYLKRMPIDVIKVDRSFVDGLGTDPGDTAIVTAVVSMAHALGIVAVAEGVETLAQVEELRRLRCNVAQGWYFSRAEPRQAIDMLLSSTPSWVDEAPFRAVALPTPSDATPPVIPAQPTPSSRVVHLKP